MKITDLKFEPRQDFHEGTFAVVFFANGYGASIITGPMFYTSESKPYELAVLKGDEKKCYITYDTTITDDVLGYLDAEEVERTLNEISSLPKEK